MVATECYEVTLPGLLEALESPRHGVSLCLAKAPLKPKEGLSGPLRGIVPSLGIMPSSVAAAAVCASRVNHPAQAKRRFARGTRRKAVSRPRLDGMRRLVSRKR